MLPRKVGKFDAVRIEASYVDSVFWNTAFTFDWITAIYSIRLLCRL